MVGAATLVIVPSSRSAIRTTMSMAHISAAEGPADGVGTEGLTSVGDGAPTAGSEVMDIALAPFEPRIRCHQKVGELVGARAPAQPPDRTGAGAGFIPSLANMFVRDTVRRERRSLRTRS